MRPFIMTTFTMRGARLAVIAAVLAPTPAYAQLDPLLFLKTQQPNVILAVETANRMQRDPDNTYYDPGTYQKTGAGYEAILGLLASEADTSYRRKFYHLLHENVNELANQKFKATRIEAVGDKETTYQTFYERTRLAIARRALIQAISENTSTARFALIKTRQSFPAMPSAAGNEGPVKVSDLTQQTPTDQSTGKWKVTRTTVTGSNSTHTASGLLVAADAASANSTITTWLSRDVNTAGALLPAGSDADGVVDAPVGYLLDDALAHATTLVARDGATGCRNTIVVLITGGSEGTINAQNLVTKAAAFKDVSGRRVPIYVIGLFPSAGEAAVLQQVATQSG
ncbi:MAG: hypothetical protein ICV72_14850, partial [Aldersonia sp.]|nr:hypothetical protein [Aldersonia sp.]